MADIAELKSIAAELAGVAAELLTKYNEAQQAANSSNFGRDANGQVADEAGFLAARQAQVAARKEYQAAATAAADAEAAVINAERAAAPPPVAQPTEPQSAAQTANDDAPQGPTASPQQEVSANGRVVVKPDTTTPSNSETPNTTDSGGGDSGLNSPTRTQAQTQTIQNSDDPYGLLAAEDAAIADDEAAAYGHLTVGPKPPLTGTAAAPGDDAGTKSSAQQSTELNQNFNAAETITPQPNILDNFYSYTYTASVYLMTPAQYQKLLASRKKSINGYQLLFQSGGAANNVGGARGAQNTGTSGQLFDTEAQATAAQTAGAPDAGRNPFFPNDFYIDSITIDNALPGKMTGAAHMVTGIKFTVVEPNGITLLDRLYQAVQDHVPKDGAGAINYTAVSYLMVIRWYGYDENGKLRQVGGTGPEGTSDPNAVTEKFIPFIIRKINWGVSNKLVTYEFDCAAVGQQIAGTTRRGTVPYDVQLTASTVGELLGNNVTYSAATTSAATPGATTTASDNTDQSDAETRRLAAAAAPKAPPNASAAPSDKKTLKQGLMGAMNEFQQDLVARKIYQRADSYKIVFANGAEKIRDAKIILPGNNVNKKSTAQAQAPDKNTQSLDPAKVAMDISTRNFAITAGQQILQAIDLAIRNSTYIADQALVVENEDGTTEAREQARTNPVQWYQITMSAVQGKYDTARNDYAYDITFTISPYLLQNFDSKYFPPSKFKGVHKTYPYWFTGMNTAVLDFQQNFNSLYNITVTGSSPETSAAAQLRKKYTSSMREIPYYTYQPRSNESSSGAELKGNEVAANAAEYLYSPSDLARTKVRIIGDPAWIQQGSLFAGVSPTAFNYSAFNPDGTINFDSQQVLFEISWQKPEDYDLGTGLADPYAKSGGNRQPIQSNVYQCTKVTSEFRQGRFEQTLEGSLYMFPVPSGKNTAPGAKATDSTMIDNTRPAATTTTPSSRSATVAQTGSSQAASTENSNAPMQQPPAPAEATNVDAGGDYSGGLTDEVASPGPALAPESNGEDVGWYDYDPPPKLGETGAPQVSATDLGDFNG